jgi:DNA-binding response OmpR family regulator
VLEDAGPPTVLVIEDDATDRAFLTTALAQAGYAVEQAATGSEGLAILRRRRVDLISLDMILPDALGIDLLRDIRSETLNRDTPVLVVSVVAGRSIANGYALVDYLVKPITPDLLLASLGHAGLLPDRPAPVLVDDDDLTALRYAEEILGASGYRSICRADAASALQVATETKPGAVVLDLILPGMSGFEFLERFRRIAERDDVPIIVWTGKDLTPAERLFLRERASAVLAKAEGTPGDLIVQVGRYLRPPRLRATGGDGPPIVADRHGEEERGGR